MTSQFADMTSPSNFIDIALFLLSSLVTTPSFMATSSLVLELWQFSFIRNWPEIRKSETPPSQFFPNIWRLGQVRNTKFDTNVSNEILLNAAECQVYSVYHFGVIKGKPTAGGGVGDKITSPLRLGLKSKSFIFSGARVKIRKIFHVNFEMTSQFLFKFCIVLHCHDITSM